MPAAGPKHKALRNAASTSQRGSPRTGSGPGAQTRLGNFLVSGRSAWEAGGPVPIFLAFRQLSQP